MIIIIYLSEVTSSLHWCFFHIQLVQFYTADETTDNVDDSTQGSDTTEGVSNGDTTGDQVTGQLQHLTKVKNS